MTKWVLVLVFVLGFLLRFISLSTYPTGFTPDEASFGYDAYSLLKTGRDQWGEPWPLVLRSFGDFKPPLYSYLSILPIAIFGLSEFSTRFTSAIFGSLSIVVTYLMVIELFKISSIKILKDNHEKIAILSAFLLSISPWHISLSRGAFEASLTVFFMTAGVWAFMKGLEKRQWLYLSAVLFGLNLFSYHSARLITPLAITFLIFLYSKKLFEGSKHNLYMPLIVFLLFFIPTLIQLFGLGGARGSDIAIFNPTGGWGAVSDRQYEAMLQGVPFEIERIFVNKLTYTFDLFIEGYLSYLSPRFLFIDGAGEMTYGMISGRGVLYIIEFVFVTTAIFYIIKDRLYKSREIKFVLFWLLISSIPAALAKGPGFAANRVAVMMPSIQIISALGVLLIYLFLSSFRLIKLPNYILKLSFVFIMLISLLYFIEDYLFHLPIHSAKSMLYGRESAIELVKEVEDNYDTIVFDTSLSEPHIHIAFYNSWEPKDYQLYSPEWLKYEDEGRSFVDQLGEYKMGKYVFSDVNKGYKGKVLLVGKPEDFDKKYNPLAIIDYPYGESAIIIVDPNQNIYANAI